MKVEYLIIIDSESSFCRDKKAFNSLMQSDSDIEIDGCKLKYKDYEIDYDVQVKENDRDKNRFFHVKLTAKNSDRIGDFMSFLKIARSLFHKASDQKKAPQLLWDDVGFYFSEKAYPMIYEIENLMRKLITKFMLTNVGLGWTKDNIPDDLRNHASSVKIDNNNNYLYETDFIQLSSFLFDEYRTINVAKLVEKLKSIDEKIDHSTISDLKSFIPISNWERYFKSYVHCEGEYLKKRWEKLYKLRCKIAHNNYFSEVDFNEVYTLFNEVKPKLQSAIDSLDEIKVPENERDDVAEDAAINASYLYGRYIEKWRALEQKVYDAAVARGLLRYDGSVITSKNEILKFFSSDSIYGFLPNYVDDIKKYRKIRDLIVHGVFYVGEDDMVLILKELDCLIHDINLFLYFD